MRRAHATLAAIFVVALITAVSERSPKHLPGIFLAILSIHVGNGVGFLKGLLGGRAAR